MDIVAYLLSRTYVKKTLKGMGALKGAACKVKTIVHQNKENIVTFEWEDTDGVQSPSCTVAADRRLGGLSSLGVGRFLWTRRRIFCLV